MPSPWSCTRRPAANTNLSPLLSPLPLFASSPTPSLLQGRPLREQQELAAAVIQRCYKKYKQVSSQRWRCCPVYRFTLVSSNTVFRIPSSPSSFSRKLTWIALKVIWTYMRLERWCDAKDWNIWTFRRSRSRMFLSQYALYKKMTLAAILIQSKFRSYYEQKKFQQSRRAAMLIQQYYRSYKELGRPTSHSHAAAAAALQHKLRYGRAAGRGKGHKNLRIVQRPRADSKTAKLGVSSGWAGHALSPQGH